MKITPTGRLVYNGPPETAAWYRVRREGITGTDLPKILGLSKYGNALSVWRDKRGELQEEVGEAADWGKLLEDVIAHEWARRNDTTVRPVGVIANTKESWQRASLDRLVTRCPDSDVAADSHRPLKCGLEIKTRSAYKRGSWSKGEPDDVLAQVTWGLLVTGLAHMHIAVLIGGQEMLQFTVHRDKTLEAYLVDAARPVWQAVQDGYPPTVHPDAEGVLVEQLNAMYVHRSGEVALPPSAAEWISAYGIASRTEREAKQAKIVAKGALLQMLGDGDTGTIDDVPVFTYLPGEPHDEVTSDALQALAVDDPDLYKELVVREVITKTNPSPRFNLKKQLLHDHHTEESHDNE